MVSNTDLLYHFCNAASHEHCSTWEEHRTKLNQLAGYIHGLIAAIPDAIATGKASQAAAEAGQTTLLGADPVSPPQLLDHKDPTLPPANIWFVSDDLSGQLKDGEMMWVNTDPHVPGFYWYKEDARAAVINAYKPRRVQIFWDGEPDEWNEWR